MTVLGIETSTAVCSVGLFRADGEKFEQSINRSNIHAEKLLTLTQSVLLQARLNKSQLDAIAISIGPGSFTGLRIGLSAAKGLCFALEKPLIAVSTFASIAYTVSRKNTTAQKILVALDAKKGDFYVHFTVRDASGAEDQQHVRLLSQDQLGALYGTNPDLVVVTDQRLAMEEMFGKNRTYDVHPYCRGDSIALLAREKALRKEFASLDTLEPFYVRDFIVEKKSSGMK